MNRLLLLLLVLLVGVAPPLYAQTIRVSNGATIRLQSNSTFNVGHDLVMTGGNFLGSNGTLAFNGTGDQQFTPPAPPESIPRIVVDKAGGDVVLRGNLLVSTQLSVLGGDVDLNGFNIDLGGSGLLRETPGNTVKGTSGVISARRVLNAPTSENVAGLGAEISTRANLGVTQISRGHTIQRSEGSEGIARYFDITPTNNSGLNADLIFHYDESELNGTAELDLRLFRSTNGGASFTEEGGTPNVADNTVSLRSINAFSRWTLAGAGLLPVELVAFEALVDGATVAMRWKTASESNNAGFEIQRRDGADEIEAVGAWETLGWIDGVGTTVTPQSYGFEVHDLAPGPHRFRLKQVDFDGTFAYSPEVEVAVELPEAYLLTAPYPNPFNPEAHLSLMVQRAQHVEVVAFDALGRAVRTLYAGRMEAGHAQALVFEASDLPTGIYFLRATGETFTTTRQAMLVK